MQVANRNTVLGDFDDVTVKFHNIETRLYREGQAYKVATLGTGGKPGVFTIKYTFGHYPLQQYLIDIGAGHLQALNIAWDSRSQDQGGQRWYHLQPDENIDPDHPFFWTRHFQNSNSRCIECHASNVSKNYVSDNKSYQTTWSEIGIGCESCHGPASKHLELAMSGQLNDKDSGFEHRQMPALAWAFRGDDDIASASGMRNDSFIDTCGGCHSRRSSLADVKPLAAYHDQYRLALIEDGLYFADGQINDEVFVLGSFLQSKMHQRGVTCNNCHDPHSGKLIAEGNSLCAQCHKPARFDTSEHHRHQPGSSGAQCVSCHMPERLYMSVDQRADHGFSIPDPALSLSAGTPNACITCHQDQSNDWAAGAMSDWGVTTRQDNWALINRGLDRQDMLMFKGYARNSSALALPPMREATLTSKLAGFPSRLAAETASPKLTNPDPLIRRAAVTALSSMPPQVRWQLLNPLIEDPVKSVRFSVANNLADVLAQLSGKDAEGLGKLIDEFREYLNYSADTPFGQLALGNLESSLGFSILAERAYQQALAIEPRFVPALVNLADLYRSIGSDGEARALLQKAVETAPDSAVSNHAYGLFLVRSGKSAEALKYLRAATRQQDSNPRHLYVYAVALDSGGQTDAAIDAIDKATRDDWPNNLELYYLQVSYMDKIGKTKGINRYLSVLASVASNNPQVQAWMKKYSGS